MHAAEPQPTAEKKGSHLRSAYAVLLCAAAMLYAAAWLFSNAREQVQDWERAPGVVVDMDTVRVHRGTRNATRSYPLFRFTAADGQEYTVRSAVNRRDLSCALGDEVTVLYPQGKPQEAVILSVWGMFKWSIVLGLVGAAQAVAGALILLFNHPRTRERAREMVR